MEKGSMWRKHLDKSQMTLDHPDPTRFVRGPWRSDTAPPVLLFFLVYRFIISILFLCGLIWSWIVHWNSGKWLIFLTHWGFVVCSLQSFIGTVLVLQTYRKQKISKLDWTFDLLQEEQQMPLCYKIYWVLYNIALTVAIFITILYWSILYDPNKESIGSDGPFFLNFVVHAGNTILCLVELVVGGLPARFLHAMHPILFTLLYIIFNVIYWAAGGLGPFDKHYIYPVLDWKDNPGLAMGIVFGGAALLVTIHTVLCALARLRTMCARKLRKRGGNNIVISTLPPQANGNLNKGFEL